VCVCLCIDVFVLLVRLLGWVDGWYKTECKWTHIKDAMRDVVFNRSCNEYLARVGFNSIT
jgi:hypothetical protein